MPAAHRTTVFISYCRKDEHWLTRLQVHLRPLEREQRIQRFDDTLIKPGTDWRSEIRRAIEITRVAILLVSADFLASEFIMEDELPPLLLAAKRDGATIVPVVVSPCRFLQTPSISRFQGVNDPTVPLTAMSIHEQEQVFLDVAKATEEALLGAGKTVVDISELHRLRSELASLERKLVESTASGAALAKAVQLRYNLFHHPHEPDEEWERVQLETGDYGNDHPVRERLLYALKICELVVPDAEAPAFVDEAGLIGWLRKVGFVRLDNEGEPDFWFSYADPGLPRCMIIMNKSLFCSDGTLRQLPATTRFHCGWLMVFRDSSRWVPIVV